MLRVEALEAGYGTIRVLHGIDFQVAPGEIVALMGRNGVGKTTLIRAIMGQIHVTAGRISLDDTDITNAPSHRIAHAGIGLVPEGRQIFPNLNVEENLVATARPGADNRWSLARVLEMFPNLAERRSAMGTQLSGGEQQMLAIGRALMTQPRILILDEATEGLAPQMRKLIWSTIAAARDAGLGVVVVDRDISTIASHADRCVVVKKGTCVWRGGGSDLLEHRSEVISHMAV